jgi:hypothetical protein
MKYEISKEWCEWAAKIEEESDCSVSAGHPSKILHFLKKPGSNNNPSKG